MKARDASVITSAAGLSAAIIIYIEAAEIHIIQARFCLIQIRTRLLNNNFNFPLDFHRTLMTHYFEWSSYAIFFFLSCQMINVPYATKCFNKE